MTTLEVITVILAAISIVSGFVLWITSWRASAEREKLKTFVDSFGFAAVLKAAESSMKEGLSNKEREVITRIVWRSSGVSLVSTLNNLQEKLYLFQALANPSEYPWEKEGSERNS